MMPTDDLLYRFARHVRNTDEIHPATWGVQGINLLAELRELDPDRYDREVKAIPSSASSPVPPEQEGDVGPRSRIDDWPIVDVLGHLASATEHLLQHHNCDEHGHELWKYAAEAAWKHVALLNQPAATSTPVEQERVQCADCLAWIDRNANHNCRQQLRRNQRSAR